ncbi:MAG: hypothetical protein ACI382_03005 [Alloprevotella sp.]
MKYLDGHNANDYDGYSHKESHGSQSDVPRLQLQNLLGLLWGLRLFAQNMEYLFGLKA